MESDAGDALAEAAAAQRLRLEKMGESPIATDASGQARTSVSGSSLSKQILHTRASVVAASAWDSTAPGAASSRGAITSQGESAGPPRLAGS